MTPTPAPGTRWECGPHTNSWGGHDARCRLVPVDSVARLASPPEPQAALAEQVLAEREGYPDSDALDPAWVAGWEDAVDHLARVLAAARPDQQPEGEARDDNAFREQYERARSMSEALPPGVFTFTRPLVASRRTDTPAPAPADQQPEGGHTCAEGVCPVCDPQVQPGPALAPAVPPRVDMAEVLAQHQPDSADANPASLCFEHVACSCGWFCPMEGWHDDSHPFPRHEDHQAAALAAAPGADPRPRVVCPHEPPCRRSESGWPACGAPGADRAGTTVVEQ